MEMEKELEVAGGGYVSEVAARLASNGEGDCLPIECTVAEIEEAFGELREHHADCLGSIALRLTDKAKGLRFRAVDTNSPSGVVKALRDLNLDRNGERSRQGVFPLTVDEEDGTIYFGQGCFMVAIGKPGGLDIDFGGRGFRRFQRAGRHSIRGRDILGDPGLLSPEGQENPREEKVAEVEKGGDIHNLIVVANNISKTDGVKPFLKVNNRLYNTRVFHNIVRSLFLLGCGTVEIYQAPDWAKGNTDGWLRFVGKGGGVPAAGMLLPFRGTGAGCLSIAMPLEAAERKCA